MNERMWFRLQSTLKQSCMYQVAVFVCKVSAFKSLKEAKGFVRGTYLQENCIGRTESSALFTFCEVICTFRKCLITKSSHTCH